jgi:hypothetical protein
MPTNVGSQTVHTKFFDPLINQNTNFMALDIRKTGIYSGGYPSISSNNVSLSALSCEIQDSFGSGNQVRITTGAAVNITVTPSTPLVVLRWSYSGSSTADYMDFKAIAVGAQLSTDLVVATCTFAGSTLTGFDYGSASNPYRSTPNVMDLVLKVEPTIPASMTLRVRYGIVNYGVSKLIVPDQTTSTIVPPNSGSRVDLIQINTSGNIVITSGAPGSPGVAPSYGGLITLAEVVITSGQSSITASSITDVRNFITVTVSPTLNSLLPSQTGNAGKSLITDGVNPSWDSPTYAA